jgi:TPR repeat protein
MEAKIDVIPAMNNESSYKLSINDILDNRIDTKNILDDLKKAELTEKIEKLLFENNKQVIRILTLHAIALYQNKKYKAGVNRLKICAFYEDPIACKIMGDIYSDGDEEHDDDVDEAFKYYIKAEKYGNNDNNLFFKIAQYYENGYGTDKDKTKALEYYLKCASGGHYESYVKVAEFYFAEKKYSMALEYLIKIWEKEKTPKIANKLGDCHYFGDDNLVVDKNKAIEYFKFAANADDELGLYNMGLCLANGDGIEKNLTGAFEYYLKAAQKGYLDAIIEVGIYYRDGIGCNRNAKESTEWFLKAANANNSSGMFETGINYINGNGFEVNKQEGFKWLLKSAENDFDEAISEVADCYNDGIGVEKNQVEALKWYRKAAEKNDLDACYQIGNYYYCGCGGLEQDYEKAFEIWNKAYNNGKCNNADIINSLFDCYYYGKGTDKSYTAAAEILRNKDIKISGSLRRLGTIYYYGHGIEKDYKLALKYLMESLDLSPTNSRTLCQLGIINLEGNAVEKNYKEAFELFKKASVESDNNSHIYLGLCYLKGYGTEINVKEAIKYFRIGMTNCDDAQELIIDLAKQHNVDVLTLHNLEPSSVINSNKCCICLGNLNTNRFVYVPCGHTQVCKKCDDTPLKRCPLCREKIEKRQKIFV